MKICDVINLNEILDPFSDTNNMDTTCPHCNMGLFESLALDEYNIINYHWSCGFEVIQPALKTNELTKQNKCIVYKLCNEMETPELPQSQKKCCCGSHDLFNFGCRCGGE